MKKVLVFLSILMCAASLKAAFIESYILGSSSFTQTSETTKNIPQTFPGTVLMGVIVSSVSAAGSNLIIYDSSGQASGQLANVSLGNLGYYNFQVALSSGLTYTTNSNTAGVTIVYKKTR